MKKIILFLYLLFTAIGAYASNLPLIYGNNLEYLGAFKVPIGDDMSYGGSVISFSPSKDSLYIVGHTNNQLVAEISIPEPINNSDLTLLNRSLLITSFVDVTEGNRRLIGAGGVDDFTGTDVKIGGLLEYNDKLIGTSYAYYSTAAELSHFYSGLNISAAGDFSGMYAVGGAEVPTASFVSGWLSKIPEALQIELNGTVITGNGTIPIVSRTSYGPSAFSFDPDRLGVDDPALATALFYYPQGHETLSADGLTNPYWNGTTKIAGMTMVEGSRSILYFGYHGIGPRNYGTPASDPIYAFTCTEPDSCITGPKGWPVCSDVNACTTGRKGLPYDTLCSGTAGSDGCYYDPTGMGSKGPHAYPYIYQVWAYDTNDMVRVINNEIQPWEVTPYAIWTLPFNVRPTAVLGGATAYDSSTGRLYVTQPQGEKNGCCQQLPVIHVFQVNLSAATTSYHVTGKAILLGATLKLTLNGTEELTIVGSDKTEPDAIEFTTNLSQGDAYSVTIKHQPAGYNCELYNSSGTIDAKSDIGNLVVFCDQHQFAPAVPTNLRIVE